MWQGGQHCTVRNPSRECTAVSTTSDVKPRSSYFSLDIFPPSLSNALRVYVASSVMADLRQSPAGVHAAARCEQIWLVVNTFKVYSLLRSPSHVLFLGAAPVPARRYFQCVKSFAYLRRLIHSFAASSFFKHFTNISFHFFFFRFKCLLKPRHKKIMTSTSTLDYFLIEEIFQPVIFKLHSSIFIKTPRLTLVPRYVPGAPGLVSEIHLAVRTRDELRRPKPGRWWFTTETNSGNGQNRNRRDGEAT